MKGNTDRGVQVSRVELSIGSIELFRFDHYLHAFPRHAHDCFTIGVFDGDNGIISLGRTSARAADGAILAIAPETVHSAEPRRDRGWSYRSLYPSKELMSVALESDMTDAQFAAPVVDDRRIARELLAIQTALSDGISTLGIEERLLVVLRSLVDTHAGRSRHRTPGNSTSAVLRARWFLESNFAQAVRLDELSVECGVSPFHLIRSFRDAVGLTPHAYLMQLRATRARQMLREGEGISAVAYRCGFVDQSHLTRTFKKMFGVTPGAYFAGARRSSS
jgi:AraC-like DNA-binding protein